MEVKFLAMKLKQQTLTESQPRLAAKEDSVSADASEAGSGTECGSVSDAENTELPIIVELQNDTFRGSSHSSSGVSGSNLVFPQPLSPLSSPSSLPLLSIPLFSISRRPLQLVNHPNSLFRLVGRLSSSSSSSTLLTGSPPSSSFYSYGGGGGVPSPALENFGASEIGMSSKLNFRDKGGYVVQAYHHCDHQWPTLGGHSSDEELATIHSAGQRVPGVATSGTPGAFTTPVKRKRRSKLKMLIDSNSASNERNSSGRCGMVDTQEAGNNSSEEELEEVFGGNDSSPKPLYFSASPPQTGARPVVKIGASTNRHPTTNSPYSTCFACSPVPTSLSYHLHHNHNHHHHYNHQPASLKQQLTSSSSSSLSPPRKRFYQGAFVEHPECIAQRRPSLDFNKMQRILVRRNSRRKKSKKLKLSEAATSKHFHCQSVCLSSNL